MPDRTPFDFVLSRLSEHGFRLASYTRAAQTYERDDGRRVVVIVAGRFVINVLDAITLQPCWELLEVLDHGKK